MVDTQEVEYELRRQRSFWSRCIGEGEQKLEVAGVAMVINLDGTIDVATPVSTPLGSSVGHSPGLSSDQLERMHASLYTHRFKHQKPTAHDHEPDDIVDMTRRSLSSPQILTGSPPFMRNRTLSQLSLTGRSGSTTPTGPTPPSEKRSMATTPPSETRSFPTSAATSEANVLASEPSVTIESEQQSVPAKVEESTPVPQDHYESLQIAVRKLLTSQNSTSVSIEKREILQHYAQNELKHACSDAVKCLFELDKLLVEEVLMELQLRRFDFRTSVDQEWNTLLHVAVGGGRLETVKQLLSARADIVPNKTGRTPVSLALSRGYASLAVSLLEAFTEEDSGRKKGKSAPFAPPGLLRVPSAIPFPSTTTPTNSSPLTPTRSSATLASASPSNSPQPEPRVVASTSTTSLQSHTGSPNIVSSVDTPIEDEVFV